MKIKPHSESSNIDKYTTPLLPISSCPHCFSTSIFRNGNKNGKQQYKCKQCKKNFFATTGTPTHGLHLRHKIEKYTIALQQGMSIRVAAQFVGISKNTSFTWRHKFISSLKNEPIIANTKSPEAITIIKTRYSDKGRKKAPEKIRKDSTTVIITQNDQVTIKKLDTKSIQKQLAKLMYEKNIVTTTRIKTLTTIKTKLQPNQILKQKKLRNKLAKQAIQQANQLKIWMKRFRGVATKYLQQYWNWYCGLQNIKILKDENQIFKKYCIENHTLFIYRKLINQ